MTTEQFTSPQRQSAVGIILIFLKVTYKFLKGFWALFIYLIIGNPSSTVLTYTAMGIGVLAVLGILYSYQYYRRFLFYIDKGQAEFVLQKGVFSTDKITIPFDKIQQVDLKRSILQRIIGVYSLAIDTAGSKGDEIHIKAITEENARSLAHILTLHKEQTQIQDDRPLSQSEDSERAAKQDREVVWQHRLSLWDLVKIGLTRSYVRGFMLTLAFVFSIYSQLQNYLSHYIDSAEAYSKSFIDSVSALPIILLGVIIFTFILSIIVTVGEVVIKHFDLKIEQTPTRLEVEMGLKTNTKVSFQPRRLQRLQIETNPIQKWLNLFEAQFSLAGSENNFKKGRITVPGLSRQIITNIKSFLYSHHSSQLINRIKPHKAWINRRFIVITAILTGVWLIDLLFFGGSYQAFILGFALFCLVIFLPYQWFLYRTIRLEITNDFLILRQGLWTQKQIIVELYKLEGVTLRQPFWYRRRQLYNLTFHTAGGDIKVRALPKPILEEINFILYKIEINRKAWM